MGVAFGLRGSLDASVSSPPPRGWDVVLELDEVVEDEHEDVDGFFCFSSASPLSVISSSPVLCRFLPLGERSGWRRRVDVADSAAFTGLAGALLDFLLSIASVAAGGVRPAAAAAAAAVEERDRFKEVSKVIFAEERACLRSIPAVSFFGERPGFLFEGEPGRLTEDLPDMASRLRF